MGYGCQREYHFHDYTESVRRTSPVQRVRDEHGELIPLTDAERDLMLNIGGFGIGGEGGECMDMIKKHLFHGVPLDKAKFKKELGDVLWGLALLAEATDTNLEEVAIANHNKLKRRYPNGFVPGGGIRE